MMTFFGAMDGPWPFMVFAYLGSAELLAMIAWCSTLLLPDGHRHTASHGADPNGIGQRWDPLDGPRSSTVGGDG